MTPDPYDFDIAPFGDTPDQRMFWDGHGCQQIFTSLLASIVAGSALQTVIAEPGLGKTVLCRKLLNSLKSHKSRYRVLYLPYPNPDFDDYLNENLSTASPGSRRTVLLLDEAQVLPDEFLIRLTGWLAPAGSAPGAAQAVLFAQPELEQRLRTPALKSLADLRTDNYQIRPFDRQQIQAYLNDRLSRAGADPQTLLNKPIVDTVWQASGGIPRLANTIMRKALLAAREDSAASLQLHHVLSATASTDATVS